VKINGTAATKGTAFYLRHINRLEVRDSQACYQLDGISRDGMVIRDVTHASLERVQLLNKYDRLTVTETPTLILRGCVYGSRVVSSATTTLIEGTSPALLNAGGDVATLPAGKGLLVKSPDGLSVSRIGIDNEGALLITPIIASPAAIPGLQGWWKADVGTSAVVDLAAVSQWDDQSGNDRHLLQTAATKQPLYVASGQNAKPVLRFDGDDDFLSATFALMQPEHVFIVFKATGALVSGDTVMDGKATNTMRLYRSSSSGIQLYAGAAGPSRNTTPQSYHAYSALFSGDVSELRVDGGAASIVNAGTNGAGGVVLGLLGPGSRFPMACEIAEVIVYNFALSAANRELIEEYLRRRWATP
jgi:hypothetical protein